VLSWEARQTRRNGRGGRRTGQVALESLEARELLAYTPLGYSLPDLTVSGYTSAAASWNGPLTVTVNVQNLGASTLIEPTQLLPGAPSHADSSPTTVDVFLSTKPNDRRLRHSVLATSIPVPSVSQNGFLQITQTFTMPTQPRGFPGDGGDVFVSFVINPTGASPESDRTNNKATSASNPLFIETPLPELVVTGVDLPPVIQPGDTVAPTIRIANIGPAETTPQGPFTVALVASTKRKLTAGSTVVATYTIPGIPGVSQVSSGSPITGDVNITPQQNIATIVGAPVTLPVRPKVYFVGVVIDPAHHLKQLTATGSAANSRGLSLPQRVGPLIPGLPPAGVLYAGGGANNLPFPYPPNVVLNGTTSTNPVTGVRA
jgi:hypothetical protein